MGRREVEEGRMIRMENTRGWQCLAVMQCERSLYTRFCARCFAEVIPNPDGDSRSPSLQDLGPFLRRCNRGAEMLHRSMQTYTARTFKNPESVFKPRAS